MMERTASQVVRQQAVRRVHEHVTEREEPISKLARTASALAKGKQHSQEGLRAVVEVEKQARNFGEDLLEDLLSLDQLSNLFPEDKSARKAEISRIDSLLEIVDATKAKLASHRRAVESKLEASTPASQTSTSATDSDTDEIVGSTDDAKPTTDRGEHAVADQEQMRDARETTMSESAARAADQLPSFTPQEALVAPAEEVWRRVPLRLQFRSREAMDGYVLEARAPGLDEKSFELVLGDHGSTLTVEGALVPTTSETAQMQQVIAARYPHIATRPSAALNKLFLELGSGTFGSFSQTFELPEDTDVEGINVSFDNGVLRIVIPRAHRRRLPARLAPQATCVPAPRASQMARAAPWGYGGYGSPWIRSPQPSRLRRGGYPDMPGLYGGLF